MNIVTFKAISRREYASGHEITTVDISVDENPLANIIGPYEKPFAEKEGHPGLAGDYHPIGVASATLEQYYLGKEDADWGDGDNKTVLLGCSCGAMACWPLLCRITIEKNKVIWSEFEQPHRDEDWDYSHFKGFEFDKQQYLNAIEDMKNA